MKRLIALLMLLLIATATNATEYLGFDLGIATKEKVLQLLKSNNASFEDDFGYKGYGSELPLVKILGYEKFSKLGSMSEAWLSFSPKGTLYKISVTYSDAGETFKVLKDALDSKYGRAQQSGGGFSTETRYRDGSASIGLLRNTFGFGNEQKTTLEYVWQPLLGEVNKMKVAIDDDIKKKNAKSVSKDL